MRMFSTRLARLEKVEAARLEPRWVVIEPELPSGDKHFRNLEEAQARYPGETLNIIRIVRDRIPFNRSLATNGK